MKVIVLSNNCSGLVNFRKEVFEALIQKGYSVTVAAPKDFKTDILTSIGCHFISTQFNRQGTNPIADLKLMLTYRRIIKQEKPALVLTYTIKPNLYGGMACRLTKTPQIANITGLGIATENPGFLRALTTILYRIGLKKTHKVFFQNQENLDFCKKHHLVTAPTTLIPGSGVNLCRYYLQPYPADDGSCRFIFISRIQHRKGIDQYLEAAKVLKTKYPNTEYHILGGCEENKYQAILDQQSKEGIIQYHGSVKDTRPYLTNIHCTVHPSFYPEGMSNVLLESCASGRPIITTDKAGCREIVNDKKTGFIVRQQDTEDLIEKMETFINLPYQQKELMGVEARHKVEKEFDRNIVIKAYLKEIKNIINNENNQYS